ncbi:MAG TPA: hypothetical protein VGO22_07200 [Pseudorhizobium sp.]|nr:hypothetical protein [Pseudorhizobium sp.]
MYRTSLLASAASLALLLMSPAQAQECDAAGTVGTGGSAAADGTSASTLGTAGACVTSDGTTSSIASGGSAAAADGKTQSRTKINENPNQLKAQSKAQAMDQGTFSKSHSKTRVKDGELQSRTRTMSHVPGEKPSMDRTESNVLLPE